MATRRCVRPSAPSVRHVCSRHETTRCCGSWQVAMYPGQRRLRPVGPRYARRLAVGEETRLESGKGRHPSIEHLRSARIGGLAPGRPRDTRRVVKAEARRHARVIAQLLTSTGPPPRRRAPAPRGCGSRGRMPLLDRCGSEPRRLDLPSHARDNAGGFSVPVLRAFAVSRAAAAGYRQATVREHSFLSNIGLIGAIALLALVANGLLNNRLPADWIFAVAISGTLVIAAAVTAATHRWKRRR